jgi:hypothetical protein
MDCPLPAGGWHTARVREIGRVELPASGARALVWVGGELYDVAAGWTHHSMDGSPPRRRYGVYGPGFDSALVAPAGDVVALLCGTGTKGLLFDPGGVPDPGGEPQLLPRRRVPVPAGAVHPARRAYRGGALPGGLQPAGDRRCPYRSQTGRSASSSAPPAATAPSESKLCVDQGTTGTRAVLVDRDGGWVPLGLGGYREVLTSGVFRGADGSWLVGDAAWRAWTVAPDPFESSPQRWLARPTVPVPPNVTRRWR